MTIEYEKILLTQKDWSKGLRTLCLTRFITSKTLLAQLLGVEYSSVVMSTGIQVLHTVCISGAKDGHPFTLDFISAKS